MISSYKFYILFLIILLTTNVLAQEVKKIELLNADVIDYDEKLLGKEIKRLTERQQKLINEAKSLKAKIDLLAAEVVGIGETTAIQLISVFPELGKLNLNNDLLNSIIQHMDILSENVSIAFYNHLLKNVK